MGNYDININVNMGDGSGGNFQSLIDSVNKLQSSMEKVGTAADTARSKSRDTVKSAASQLKQYRNEIDNAKIKMVQYAQAVVRAEMDFKKGIITQDKYNEKIEEAKKGYQEARQTLNSARQGMSQLNTQIKIAGINVNKTIKSFFSLKNVINSLTGVMGFSISMFSAFMVIKNTIKTISEFELSQKKLRAVLGETAGGMEELSQSAIQVGRSSIFGAKGVSELQVELAKMGFTKKEIMAMQSAIVDLATATQEDLADSAEVVANILRSFNLTATETRDVVNVMGSAFNKSALDLTNFREAIKYVAPVAQQAGFSFKETAAAMMVLANAGIKGSLTGTAFNNVLKAMMDENSKLSKAMGGTVQGWEGFVSVLQKAREEGFNIQDIFGLITQRATAAFSVFKDNLPTIEEMNKALENVSDVIANQAIVQLDSLTYRTKLLKSAWQAFILEMDEGDNMFSKFLKNTLTGATNLLKWLTLDRDKIGEAFKQLKTDIEDALNLEGVSDEAKNKLNELKTDVDNFLFILPNRSKKDLIHMYDEVYGKVAISAEEHITKVITTEATKRIEALNLVRKNYQEWEDERNAALIVQGVLMERLKKEGKESSLEYRIAAETVEKLNKLTFQREKTETRGEEEKKKAIRDRYQLELEYLKLQMKLSEEKIKLLDDEAFHEYFILESNFEFKRKIAEKELEMAIALGEEKEKLQRNHDLEMEILAVEFVNKKIAIFKKGEEQIAETIRNEIDTFNKAIENSGEGIVDERVNEAENLIKFFEKWRKDNPIQNLLFGNSFGINLFTGLIDKEDLTRFTELFNNAFESIGKNIESYVDSWVEATDRVVQQLNRQIDETQSALQTETQLMAQGYANNVSLKKKELEDLKQARKRALQEQRQAQQAQVTIDTVMQMSSLITASAEIFKTFSKMGVFGVPLAIAMIAVMFGSFAAAKVKAMQVAGLNKFEEGGWVGGKRHSEGGTVLEAEKDEFIVRRKSALKYRSLIEAVNKDNMPEINRWYLNRMRSQVMSATVSLDKSKELIAIRRLLEGKSHRNVQYFNGYRIESDGITRTKILMN